MGFAEGYNAVASHMDRQASNETQRRQQELTALQLGYEYDQNAGAYKATDRLQTAQAAEIEQMKAQLAAIQSANEKLQSQLSADSITNTIDSIVSGDWHNAKLHYGKVKDIMAKQPSLNVADIEPINFSDPMDIEQLKNIGIDPEVATGNKEVQDAFNRSMIKVTGNDGTKRIVAVDDVVKATNTWNMYNTQQRDRYTEAARVIDSIYKGAGILSSEERLKQQQVKTAGIQEDTKQIYTIAQQQQMVEYLQKPGATMQGLQALMEPPKPLTPSERVSNQTYVANERKLAISNYINSNSKDFNQKLEATTGDTPVDIGGGNTIPLNEVAKTAQGDAKLDVGQKTMMSGLYSSAVNMKKLRDKLVSSDYDYNAMAKVMQELQKVDPADLMKMTPEQKQTFINRAGFDSELKTVLAGYIKAMSGAAVSDEERKFYESAILGGNWSNKDAALASMKGFITGVTNGFKSNMDAFKTTLPYDYLQHKDLYEAIRPPTREEMIRAIEEARGTRQ